MPTHCSSAKTGKTWRKEKKMAEVTKSDQNGGGEAGQSVKHTREL